MTLHPIPLNFLINEQNFLFFFISVVTIFLKEILAGGGFFTITKKANNYLKYFDFISGLVSFRSALEETYNIPDTISHDNWLY
jgi:hypothetical protein